MIYITGDIGSLATSNQWRTSSTHPLADWHPFYSTMNGYGFWGENHSWIMPVYDDEMFPF
jgi:hypothetical protein